MTRADRPVRKGNRWPRRFAWLALALALAGSAYLAGGFVRFARDVAALSAPPVEGEADGIVVLTGGEQRLRKAISLLREGQGRRLLISGVNRDTSPGAIARATETERALIDCCVDLDYEAMDTIGNAEMTARWAREHGFDRLLLVTSDYHIPRSLLEMSGIEGAPEIVPYPVSPDKLWRQDGWPTRLGLRLLATEYAKVLVVKARLSFGVELPGLSTHHRMASRAP
ncbi:YdcF family protein [Aureimonas sp. ME7]|uniref:YdcF family protein n=1 Tax=Aureimonas sp. ME7 TaxID=2744252 RepID=UPI0015F40EE9|nr:YdcF family protein [Aureimonas sp. ME7]